MKIFNKHFFDGFVLSFKDYKFNSIFIRNYKLILLILVIPILLLISVIYGYNTKIINQQIESNNKNTLIKIKNEIDNITERSNVTATKLSNYAEIRSFAAKDKLEDTYDNILLIEKIQKQISYAASTINTASDIIIHFRNTNYFIAVDSSWTGFFKENFRKIPSAMINYENPDEGENYFIEYGGSMFLKAYIRSFGEVIGAVIIKTNNDVIMGKVKTIFQTPESRMFILDTQKNIVIDSRKILKSGSLDEYYPQIPTLLNSDYEYRLVDFGGVKSIASAIESSNMKWRYILVSPTGVYKKSILNMKYAIGVLVIFILLITLAVSWMITYKLYRPIQIIIDVIRNKNGSFKDLEASDYKRVDEIGFISTSIKDSQIQNIVIRTELEHKMDLLKRAQTVALQAQINPHFLYNTLESINWKALQLLNGQNDISRMVNDLSKLLRLSLDAKSHLVTMGTEIQHVKLYIKIQENRFKDRFSVEWDVSDNIMEYKMVKLTLQPLIENALIHGMGKLTEKVLIKVASYEKNNCIEFFISDNGVGIDAESLNAITQRLTDSTLENSDHLGLVNVNQRIQLAFGLDYGIKLESSEAGGVIVKMTLPKVQ